MSWRWSVETTPRISADILRAHIALDGTQYVRFGAKAITIRFRENCPIPYDTNGEYRKIYSASAHFIHTESIGCQDASG